MLTTKIPGKNVVLYSKREYEDNKVDIIHVYSNDIIKTLNILFYNTANLFL